MDKAAALIYAALGVVPERALCVNGLTPVITCAHMPEAIAWGEIPAERSIDCKTIELKPFRLPWTTVRIGYCRDCKTGYYQRRGPDGDSTF